MKAKFFFASMLMACAALVANAQGYKDGIDFYKIGRLDDAQELLERNLNNAETNKAEAYYYLGQIALDKNDMVTAGSYFDKGVQANANYAYNYVGKGVLLLKENNPKEAEKLFKQAEKCTKKDPKLAIAIARAYYNVDPNAYAKQIEKQTTNAFKWNSQDPDYYIFKGDDLGIKKEWGQAAGQYELAFGYEPTNIESRVKFANVDFFLNEERSVNALEELLTLVPNSALVQRELAEKYYGASSIKGNVPKALEHYGAYYNNPNHFAKDEIRYAQLLWMSKDYDKAVSVCNEIIAKAETPANIFFGHRMKFYSLCDMKDWENAVNTGNEFFALPENEATPYLDSDYMRFANALRNADRETEAVSIFERAIAQFPENSDFKAHLASIYNKNKDYEKAALLRQQIVEGGDYTVSDLYQLGAAYCRVGENTQDEAVKQDAVTKARVAIKELLEKAPNEMIYLNLAARAEVLAENYEYKGGALDYYKRLLDAVNANKDDENANYYYQNVYRYLATYYKNIGQMDVAKDYYRKWLESDPENENLRKFVESIK